MKPAAVGCLITACLLPAVLGGGIARGQSSSGSGMSGNLPGSAAPSMFGGRNLGSGVSGGARSFGSFGSNASGGTGTYGGMGSSPLMQQQGGFIGTTAQEMQRGFIGANPAARTGVSGYRNSTSSGGMPMMGSSTLLRTGYPSTGGAAGRPAYGQAAAGGNSSPIRPEFQVGFDPVPIQAEKISTGLAKRLARTPAVHTLSPIQVELKGRTAVLRGTVATEHDRTLAEQMALLEVGIGTVQNELVIASSQKPEAAAATAPPKGAFPAGPATAPGGPAAPGSSKPAP